MTDQFEPFADIGSLLGTGFLAEGEELIILAEAEMPAVTPEVATLAAAPTLLAPPGEDEGTETHPESAKRDALSLDEDNQVAPYLDEAASFTTAANAPAPDQLPQPGGNGIFVPFESVAPLVGLEAVGVLAPT